jgi:thiosulfate/3-mercaptopyruvate sulfurtransferase
MMLFTTLIDVASLRETTNGPAEGRPLVLDCRFDLGKPAAGREAYLTAHIPGARYADLNLDLSAPISADSGRHPLPSADLLAERFASFGIDDDTQVVAYDDANGSLAARAWWLLRWLGHPRVAVLDGGFKAWVAGGGAVESGEPDDASVRSAPRRTERFAPPVKKDAVVTAPDVLLALRDPARLLVDARAPERFAGTVEPLDPVAGHIPGAVNHPFSSNLAADGRFLPAAELRHRWEERLAGTAPGNVILMCGSGVTACHNQLAMELAGLQGAKLYAGSWSEWIRDPERPVARGDRPDTDDRLQRRQ